ncbi:hypothetical protein BDY21DRAFT_344402 [Lineolata rhizophorae]|uniref:Zn(2)-C6 fungal-type domain-containing protein n=1 Tax=Lineolata rhizophorae TaxID=578093 RepID=A0A6A6P0V6_9PEZI|nr:hypothetical protein BDY21DRAFT_344402 [Lineolata rhizophorae]
MDSQTTREGDSADVDEILRRKRKTREYKACYPCRKRKVGCDQAVPCGRCVDRHHPELCTWHPPGEAHPPASQVQHAQTGVLYASSPPSNGNATITVRREDWDNLNAKLSAVEKAMSDLKGHMRQVSDGPPGTVSTNGFSPSEPIATPQYSNPPIDSHTRHVNAHGVHTESEITGQVVHLGGSSVPALVMALGRRNNGNEAEFKEILGKSILPLFGLDNESSTYPFVDLWGLPHGSITRVEQLCSTLPGDSECMSFLRHYRDTAYVVYPAVAEIDKLESDLLTFLMNRRLSLGEGIREQSAYGYSLSWLSILFAALASGCQVSGLPRKERELTSQVYVCCSFECLRATNLFSHTNLETIQTLLILGNVISNNMNAGVAWSLLGLTLRLAQSLGLHRPCPESTPEELKVTRSKIWWALLWQDSLLSITYDRASASAMTFEHPLPTFDETGPGYKPYRYCMYRLCKVGLDIVRERACYPRNSSQALERITEHRNELQNIMMEAADYLKDSRRCTTMRDQLEHWALYLHMSYIASELCRPAISPSTPDYDLTKTLRKACIDSLANTVEAFLGLQNVTSFATRSWAAVHRSLSSALLLGILGEPSRNERVRMLVGKLIAVMSEITSTVDPAELSGPISRSIVALRRWTAAGSQLLPSGTTEAPDVTPSMPFYGFDEVDLNPNLDPALFPQSPLARIDQEYSPHQVMDTILWGGKRT